MTPATKQAIRTVISQFRTKCDKAEYTDTGECWEVFEYIERVLTQDTAK